jgi:hypothetical protein
LRHAATLGLVLLGLAVLGAPPQPASAATIAVTISDLTGNVGPTPGATLGWEFTVNSPITVTQLGVFDAGQDGLADSHPVGIFDLGANLLVSGTVTTADPLTNQFRYINVAPTPLNAGQTYRIGGFYPTGADTDRIQAHGFSTAPEIQFTDGYGVNTGVLAFPSTKDSGVNPGSFGPNFQFVAAVPEPGTLALTGLEMLGLVVWLRRRKKAS